MFGAIANPNKSSLTIPDGRMNQIREKAIQDSANTLIIPDETNTAYDFYDRYVDANNNYEAAKQARDLNSNMVSYENWKKQYGRKETFPEYLNLLNKEVIRLAATRLDVLVEFNDYLEAASRRGAGEAAAVKIASTVATESAKEAVAAKRRAAEAQSRAASESSKKLDVYLIKEKTEQIKQGEEVPGAKQIEITDPTATSETRAAANDSEDAAFARNESEGVRIEKDENTGFPVVVRETPDYSKYILIGGALFLGYLLLSRKNK